MLQITIADSQSGGLYTNGFIGGGLFLGFFSCWVINSDHVADSFIMIIVRSLYLYAQAHVHDLNTNFQLVLISFFFRWHDLVEDDARWTNNNESCGKSESDAFIS